MHKMQQYNTYNTAMQGIHTQLQQHWTALELKKKKKGMLLQSFVILIFNLDHTDKSLGSLKNYHCLK